MYKAYENLPDIDHDAHASVRVMAQCMAMDQAAGVAGALASSQEITPHQVPVAEL